MTKQTLYQRLVADGIPAADMGHHESDLHLRDTRAVRTVLDEFNLRALRRGEQAWGYKPFTSAVDGSAWLDIPFAYDPWWQNRAKASPPPAPLPAPAAFVVRFHHPMEGAATAEHLRYATMRHAALAPYLDHVEALVPAAPLSAETLELLRFAERKVQEAIEVHVYDLDNETPDEDCEFCELRDQLRAAITVAEAAPADPVRVAAAAMLVALQRLDAVHNMPTDAIGYRLADRRAREDAAAAVILAKAAGL